jgi:hypothetical protein
MVKQIVSGGSFLTRSVRHCDAVIYCAEEEATFNLACERAELTREQRQCIRFLAPSMTGTKTLADVVAWLQQARVRYGAQVVIVDTLAHFARFQHGGEQDASTMAAACLEVRRVVTNDTAVALVHHNRKSGGGTEDAIRGSNSLTGGVDQTVLVTGVGKGFGPVRHLRSSGRLGRWDTYVELRRPAGYIEVGRPASAREKATTTAALTIPRTAATAQTINDLVDANKSISDASMRRTVDQLVSGGVVTRLGSGKKGSPFKYFEPRRKAA